MYILRGHKLTGLGVLQVFWNGKTPLTEESWTPYKHEAKKIDGMRLAQVFARQLNAEIVFHKESENAQAGTSA